MYVYVYTIVKPMKTISRWTDNEKTRFGELVKEHGWNVRVITEKLGPSRTESAVGTFMVRVCHSEVRVWVYTFKHTFDCICAHSICAHAGIH